MRYSHSVPDDLQLVIADASVVINLNATGCAAAILDALQFRVAVTDVVATELGEDRRSGRNDAALLNELTAAGRIAILPLDEASAQLFVGLVAGTTAETLDDGEAASIAVAVTHGAIVAIDERKARRICAQRFPGLRLLSTGGLLAHDDVASKLGRDAQSNAVFRALQTARMRVLPEDVDRIVQLIGVDRARQCPSLPKAARGL
jgi:predicted nucleic acid-binding protein